MCFSCKWCMEIKNRQLFADDFYKLYDIEHNERCFEPELNSGIMNEEEKRREPLTTRALNKGSG